MSVVTRSVSPGNRTWEQLDNIAKGCGFKEARTEFYQYAVDVVTHYLKEQKRQNKYILFVGLMIVAVVILQVIQLVWNI